MEAPLWLLLVWGGIGSIDFVYNHMHRYRLHAQATSLQEHSVHTLLTLALTVTVMMLVFVEMGTLGFTIFLGVQACAVIFTLWDVWIEPASRASFGGLPPDECLIHTIVFMIHGAFLWVVIANADLLVHGAGFGVWRWPSLPTFLLLEAVIFAGVAVGVLALHVYLLGVSYRTFKTVPGVASAGTSRS